MKLKKLISVILSLTMMLAMFAGCGNSAAEDTTEAPKAETPAAEAPAASAGRTGQHRLGWLVWRGRSM